MPGRRLVTANPRDHRCKTPHSQNRTSIGQTVTPRRGSMGAPRGAVAGGRFQRGQPVAVAAAGAIGAPVAGPPHVLATPKSPLAGVEWTINLGGFLLYLLVITSYRLPVGDIAILAALGGIFLQRGGIRFPPYLAWLTVFTGWVRLAPRGTQ
jgi:hypothetical protein